MLNQESIAWRELYRSASRHQARVVATSIAAMEYEVRLLGDDGGAEDDEPAGSRPGGEAGAKRAPEVAPWSSPLPVRRWTEGGGGGSRYVIEVPAAVWAELTEVLDEIIAEQEEFDDFLERCHSRSQRAERRVVLSLIVLIALLAVLGLIEL